MCRDRRLCSLFYTLFFSSILFLYLALSSSPSSVAAKTIIPTFRSICRPLIPYSYVLLYRGWSVSYIFISLLLFLSFFPIFISSSNLLFYTGVRMRARVCASVRALLYPAFLLHRILI